MRQFLYCCCAWTISVLAASSTSAEEPLSRAELNKRGKAATVYIENGRASGSGFCVSSSGLFITNEHVAAGAESLTVVLNSGLKTQQIVKARVIRADKDLDLALLRADGAKNLPTLPLGSVDKITETMEVVAFGFPFGKMLDAEANEYPAVSVNGGAVTSLRQKSGELYRIQVDAALNPGNSGGPLLGSDGAVVGVVVAGLRGTGVNFVIPVSHLSAFLAKPDFDFQLPSVTRATISTAIEFRAKALPLIPGGKPLSVELILTGVAEKPRSYPMEKDGDEYWVKAIPAPLPDGPAKLRATFTYPDGAVIGRIGDYTLAVGGKPYKLSELRGLRWQPSAAAVGADGKAIEGAITGLDGIAVDLGKETVRLKLDGVESAQFDRIGAVESVTCAVVVRQDGNEVWRTETTLFVSDPSPDQAFGPNSITPLAIRPPALDGDKVMRALPEAADDASVGAGGRFLIFHLPKLRQLAIFDANAGKVVKFLQLGVDNVVFAASQDKLLVVQTSTGVIERWSLKTFDRETTTKLTMQVPPVAAALGSASGGPLVISGVDWPRLGETAFVDVQKMRRIDTPIAPTGFFHTSPEVFLRVSANGKLFTCQQQPHSTVQTCIWAAGAPRLYSGEGGVAPVPGPDGAVIYTTQGCYDSQMKKVSDSKIPCLPACQGPYYLGVTRAESDRPGSIFLYAEGDAHSFAEVSAVEGLEDPYLAGSKLTADKRIFLIPDAKLLVTLSRANDKLVLRRVDTERLLEQSDLDYMLVASRPPVSARKGEDFTYQVRVKSRKSGVKYKLASGPPNMQVNANGHLVWKVPADFHDSEVAVAIVVQNDAGREITHSFSLNVTAALSQGPEQKP